VSKKEIDEYLGTLDEPKTATLAQLRETIVPDAEQCISYGMPAFKLRGKTIAGFAAFKSHLSYLPHSGSSALRCPLSVIAIPAPHSSEARWRRVAIAPRSRATGRWA
jgi:uncharacterized protein YdhG (YjbR/CyaY superfamily)